MGPRVRPRSPRPNVTRSVGRELLARCRRTGGEALLGDKGYAARECAGVARQLDAAIVCPRLFTMMGPCNPRGDGDISASPESRW